MEAIKPTFIGIGGQKCASTWLSECLRSHPEVFMSSPKEIRYFVDNKQKSVDWYLSFFAGSDEFELRGEFSSNYVYHPECASEIRNALGKVKILAVVRDPVERSLSHIKHLIRDGNISPMQGVITKNMLEEIVKKHPAILRNSLYVEGLKAFQEEFGASNLFIVSQDQCKHAPGEVLRTLWEFLDVTPDVEIPEADRVVSVGVNPRFLWLEKIRKKVFAIFRNKAPRVINWMRKSGLSAAYRKINKGREITFSDESINYIKSLCEDDWLATQQLIKAIQKD